ncbi:hypothetical protein GF314_02125 [bacterium]|nr:hypothetical protein [bacterium]
MAHDLDSGAAPVPWLALAVAAAAVAFVVFGPAPGDLDPLPWDMSHHLLGASRLAEAARAGDWAGIGRQLTEPDLYPPGHSVLLGAWLLACGDSARSWLVFQLVTLLAGLVAVATTARLVAAPERGMVQAVALALTLGTPILLALSASFLVEAPVAILALLAIGALARLAAAPGRGHAGIWTAVAALLVAAALLTKYNVGLPLLVVAGVLAGRSWWRGERALAGRFLLIAAIGVVVVAAFLALQQDGWRNFLTFARNRTNAGDVGPLVRLARYGSLHAHLYVVAPAVSLVLVLLAVVAAVRRPGALTLAALTYVVATLIVLAMHPYVLGRNLFAAALVLLVPASQGAAVLLATARRRWPLTRRAWRLAGLAVGVVLLARSVDLAGGEVHRQYLGREASLQRLSQALAEELAAPGSCRVVGTFNECSPGWVRLLAARAGSVASPLRIGFAPEDPGRSSAGRRPLPSIDRWLSTHEDRVILIQVAEDSPWWTDDIARHGAWRQELAARIAARPELRTVRRVDLAADGLTVTVLAAADRVLVHGAGWGPAEPWGRWALAERATLHLAAFEGPATLRLRYAAGGATTRPPRCRVLCGGREIGTLEATGAPWEWHDAALPLPDGAADRPRTVTLVFDRCREIAGRPRAMPFETVAVDPVPVVSAAGQSSDVGLYLPTSEQ